ncbi:HD-GYP domain-containing protein [Bacillus timonensis]|nr:HD-GYP domain-containing protein [Bacillus timonensis]
MSIDNNNLKPLKSNELDDILKSLQTNDSVKSIEAKEPEKNYKEKEVSGKIEDAVKQVEDIFNFVSATEKIPLAEIKNNVIPTIQHAADAIPNFSHLFQELEMDDYTYRHNIGVGVIATLIGKWLNVSKDDLPTLTLAATLHDIGKTKIPLEILNKPGKLTSSEYALVKKHTIFGYELLSKTEGIGIETCLVALQHHEREDGRGYPFGLKSDKISYFSKIVAVADVFHAMSSDRAYHDSTPFYKVIKQMNEDVFGSFEPTILLTFLRSVMQSLVGEKVKLTNGKIGKIVMLNQFNVTMPLILVGSDIVDLSRNREIHIEKILS